jgi:hypothetical protein
MWPTLLALWLALSGQAPRKGGSRRRPAWRRPLLEVLEDRAVPASLSYSTLLNGTIYATALDSAGNVYVTGNSSNLATTPGAFETSGSGAFVAKLNPTGTAVLYATYLGNGGGLGAGITVDSEGDAYVIGRNYGVPTTPNALASSGGTNYPAVADFVAELNPAGSGLVYSTYLPGTVNDPATLANSGAIAVDGSGNIYVVGAAQAGLPVTAGAFQTACLATAGNDNAFFAKINPTLSGSASLMYASYLGGNGGLGDEASAIALDSSGNAYLEGLTTSTNFPTTAGAYQTSAGSGFVTKITPVATAGSFGVTGFSSPATAGVAGIFTVTAKGANGSVLTGYTGTVHFSSSDPHAVLPTDYTFTAADQGVHTFSATLYTAGIESITAGDAANGLLGSETGTVTAAPASTLTLSGYPSPTNAGFAASFTVTALDPYGNKATGYTGTVQFSSSDGSALLPAPYIFTAGDAGAHTFSATLNTPGTQSLTATDSGNAGITGTQANITVAPAGLSALSVTGFPSVTTAGVTETITVTARDTDGSTDTSYLGTVHFTSSDGHAVLPRNYPFNYTFTAADHGVHTFTITLKTAGSQSITATDTVFSSVTGSETGITITPAAASQLILSPNSEVQSGVRFSLTLTVEDAYGNVVTGYTGTVHFTSADKHATLPANYTFTAADAGIHTFTNAFIMKASGWQDIDVADTKNNSLTGYDNFYVN